MPQTDNIQIDPSRVQPWKTLSSHITLFWQRWDTVLYALCRRPKHPHLAGTFQQCRPCPHLPSPPGPVSPAGRQLPGSFTAATSSAEEPVSSMNSLSHWHPNQSPERMEHTSLGSCLGCRKGSSEGTVGWRFVARAQSPAGPKPAAVSVLPHIYFLCNV